jgi:hypothetical protein
MAKPLAPTEIKHRLTKLRNYEHNLYPAARARIAKLEHEVADLKAEKAQWLEEKEQLVSLIQKLQLQVEMLNAKVFGKKHKTGGDQGTTPPVDTPSVSKQPRAASSYRRVVPGDDEVTVTEHHAIDTSGSSAHAGHMLSKHRTIDYFEEDVMLPSAVRKLMWRLSSLQMLR